MQYNGVWLITAKDTNWFEVKLDKVVLPTITSSNVGTVQIASNVSGTLKLYIGNQEVNLTTKFVEDYKYGLGFSFDKTKNTWYVFKSLIADNNLEIASSESIQYVGEFIKQVELGYCAGSSNSIDGTLSNLWIKQDGFSNNVIQSFMRNTKKFISGHGNKSSRTNGYFNTLLAASFIKSLDYKFGPNRSYYDLKSWRPVNRDFVLNTDTYRLGIPIKAKFVKLEFTKPTGRYYNPATLESVVLPIYSYPAWIRKWYFENTAFDSIPKASTQISNAAFERASSLSSNKNNFGLINIKSAIEGSNSSKIFSLDKAGIDFLLNSENYDQTVLNQQITNSAIHMKFPIIGPHNYQITLMPMKNKRAYFYGIHSLEFIHTDQAASTNNKVYVANAFDDSWINSVSSISSSDFEEKENVLVANVPNAYLISKDLESFNSFDAFQFGVLESQPIDLFSYAKINLADVSHISRTDNASLDVLANVRGSSDGQTVWMKRKASEGQYGIQTNSVTLPVTTNGVKLVAACRVRSLNVNPQSTYELRLQTQVNSNWYTAATQQFTPSESYNWSEHELVYSTQAIDLSNNETVFRLQLIQTDPESNEEIYVDMLGLWMFPFKYEVVTSFSPLEYTNITYNVSNPLGLINITPTKKLRIKVTALSAGAWIAGWVAIPHYTDMPTNLTTYIFKQNDWAVSDNLEDRIASRQIFFNNNGKKMLPRRYSIYNDIIGARTVF